MIGVELVLPFLARYRIELLEGPHYFGISRRFSWGRPLDPQQEFVGGPAFAVWPDEGEPWIGAVDNEWGGAAFSDWPQRIIGWPDERSICVVWAGGAHVIRADEPTIVRKIDCDPITGLVIAAERHMIVFADHDSLLPTDQTASFGALRAWSGTG